MVISVYVFVGIAPSELVERNLGYTGFFASTLIIFVLVCFIMLQKALYDGHFDQLTDRVLRVGPFVFESKQGAISLSFERTRKSRVDELEHVYRSRFTVAMSVRGYLSTIVAIWLLIGTIHGADVMVQLFSAIIARMLGHPLQTLDFDLGYAGAVTVMNFFCAFALYWAIRINWRAIPLMLVNAILIVAIDRLIVLGVGIVAYLRTFLAPRTG